MKTPKRRRPYYDSELKRFYVDEIEKMLSPKDSMSFLLRLPGEDIRKLYYSIEEFYAKMGGDINDGK